MESWRKCKCRVEWEKIPGVKGSQVHCTLELRDCESGLNRVLILQNQLQTDTTARHRPYTAPTGRQSRDDWVPPYKGKSLHTVYSLSLSAASESTAPAAPSGNPAHASAGGEGNCRIDVAAH